VRHEIDPTVDYAFKLLFGSEADTSILIALLNAVSQTTSGLVVREVTLQNPFSAKEFEDDKQAVFDVRAFDQAGRPFIVEMQRSVPSFFAKRALMNWSLAYAEQMREGDYHATLLPAIEICILQQTLFNDRAFLHTFQMADLKRNVLLCKDAEIHMIELNKFDLAVSQVETPIERWCYFLKHAATLDLDDLPEQLRTPAIIRAMEVLMRSKQSQLESEAYRQQMLQKFDRIYRELPQEKVFDLGKEEGLEKGRKEGEIKRIHLVQRLLKLPITPDKELLWQSVPQLAEIGDQLEKQIPSE
jgi:predicted transposase/invertase (TIGR01784 family)